MEAVYAKAVITDNWSLLNGIQEYLNKPVYWYCLSKGGMNEHVGNALLDAFTDETSNIITAKEMGKIREGRQKYADSKAERLNHALKLDPNYLPALYRCAIQMPTLDEQLQELERIAEIDNYNAKPYYMMAILKFNSIVKGRKVTEESDLNAFPMSDEEWKSVSDLIAKGNTRPEYSATLVEVPSTRDIKVSTGGNVWPDAAVRNVLCLSINEMLPSLVLDGAPVSMSVSAVSRQFARQACWKALELNRKGRKTEALETLQVMYGYSDKYAASTPNRMIQFLNAASVRSITRHAEIVVQQNPANRERLLELNQDRLAWRESIESFKPAMEKSLITVRSVKVSPKEYLQYNDFSVEEEAVQKALKRLGLTN